MFMVIDFSHQINETFAGAMDVSNGEYKLVLSLYFAENELELLDWYWDVSFV